MQIERAKYRTGQIQESDKNEQQCIMLSHRPVCIFLLFITMISAHSVVYYYFTFF